MAIKIGIEGLIGHPHGPATKLHQRAVRICQKLIMLEIQRLWHLLKSVVIKIAPYNLALGRRIVSQISTIPVIPCVAELQWNSPRQHHHYMRGQDISRTLGGLKA